MQSQKTNTKEQESNSIFGKSNTSQQNNEISYKRLVLMWGLILLGYFLFVVQWYSIGNFGPGYTKNIGSISNNPALNAMPNWTITLMRGVGSILAGWLLAKIGHRYAVITVLSLMVASFPFIIFAGIEGIGAKNADGIYPINFSMFLFFRLFLAIGGTTMITYTNSVIAKMPTVERSKYMRINQFGFNGGALFANIFFCFGISKVINSNPAVWISILSIFIGLILILLVMYILFGKEVVPPQKNISTNDGSSNMITFGKVIKESYTWKLSILFAAWLVAVVFINSSTMRSVIEQSPANFQTLINWNKANGMSNINSLANTTLSTPNSVVVGSGYEWVWPTYTSLFVSGFFVGLFIIAPFNKTIYKRKFFMHLMFIIGIIFELISILCGYLGGYENKAALAFFLIFIFLSGIFLWSVQPVMLSLYQQSPQSSPKYTGIISGLIWGIGYVGYTLAEIWLSVSLSYIDNVKYFTPENIKAVIDSSQEALIKTTETAGSIIVLVGFFAIICSVFIPIQLLPEAGIKDENGVFKEFDRKWKPWEWNFKKDEILIK